MLYVVLDTDVASRAIKAGELWQERGLVFTTSVGTGYESHNLRRDFRRVTAAAGLGARWVPKELRTSFPVQARFICGEPTWAPIGHGYGRS